MKNALKYFLIAGFTYALVMAAIDTLFMKRAFDIRKFIINFLVYGLIICTVFVYFERKIKK